MPPPSGRPGETSPVASADRRDSDRRDMARRNDAKGNDDPMEDGVRAAVPRERDEYMLMRCSRAPGDRGDTPSSAERKRVSTESRCCTFRLRKDGQVMWNFDLRVVMRPGVLGDTAGRVNRVWRTCCNCAVIFGGGALEGRRVPHPQLHLQCSVRGRLRRVLGRLRPLSKAPCTCRPRPRPARRPHQFYLIE